MFRHIIYAIFFWQLVYKTADCLNNIVFILVAKITFKKVCEKMENSSTLERVLLVCNRKAEVLRLVGATFDSRMASPRRMFSEKKFTILSFIYLSLLTFELSNMNWKCSANCNMLTERNAWNDSAVFWIFLNIITIGIFIEQ